MTTIPDALPILSRGHHDPGSGKACAMDAVSWLSGKPEEGDAPSCVHPVLRAVFTTVNDWLPDYRRHELWPLIVRAMGTAPTGEDEQLDQHVSSLLGLWAAQRLPLVTLNTFRIQPVSAVLAAAYRAPDELAFLEALITEYERLTSHVPVELEISRLDSLKESVGVA